MARMHFTNDPKCVAACREFVAQALHSRPAELVDRAVLVASELVSNVVRHTPNGGKIEVIVAAQQLRLEVSDFSYDQPIPLPHSDTAIDGRGLPIVSSLASTWGVQESRAGKTIWATFSRP